MMGRKVEGSPELRALGGTHCRLWRVGAEAEMGGIVLTEEPGRRAEKIGGMKRDGSGRSG